MRAGRSTDRSRLRALLVGCVAAVALGASLLLHWRLRAIQFDDSYIHLRIARNLMRTGSAYFNDGERVMATSSPVWTVLLAACRVPLHMALLPLLEGVLLWAVGMLAIAIGWKSTVGMTRWLRAFLTAVAGCLAVAVTLTSSIGQMETPLAIALLLGAWLAALDDRPYVLPLLALAACTRLELLPLLVCALVVQLYRRRDAWPAAFAIAIVTGAMVWTQMQFGVLLPNSMRAKQITYGFTLARAFREFVVARMRDDLAWPLLLVVCAAALWEWRRSRRLPRTQWIALVALFCSLEIMAAYVVRRTMLFPWYRPLFDIPLVLGLLFYRGHEREPGYFRLGMPLVQAGLILFFAGQYVHMMGAYVAAALHPTVENQSRLDDGDSGRVMAYRELAETVRTTCRGGRLMSTEIGALGWSFEGHLDDAVGIASPDALFFQPLRSGALRGGVPVAYVAEKLPDAVVNYARLDMEMVRSRGLGGRYELLALPPSAVDQRGGRLDVGWRGSRTLNLWLRRDGPCDNGILKQTVWRQFR